MYGIRIVRNRNAPKLLKGSWIEDVYCVSAASRDEGNFPARK
jgi:hypothetical protein